MLPKMTDEEWRLWQSKSKLPKRETYLGNLYMHKAHLAENMMQSEIYIEIAAMLDEYDEDIQEILREYRESKLPRLRQFMQRYDSFTVYDPYSKDQEEMYNRAREDFVFLKIKHDAIMQVLRELEEIEEIVYSTDVQMPWYHKEREHWMHFGIKISRVLNDLEYQAFESDEDMQSDQGDDIDLPTQEERKQSKREADELVQEIFSNQNVKSFYFDLQSKQYIVTWKSE